MKYLLKGKADMIWITWEKQLRNRTMASKLNAQLYEINIPGNRIKRYLLAVNKTFFIIKKDRPRVVFAQNPSIVLTIFLLILKPLFGYKFISDSHYAGVMASHNYKRRNLLQSVLNFCNSRADLVIVTNSEQADFIKSIGGKPFICEDPLPDLENYMSFKQSENKEVLFICSFGIDEPYTEVFKAANKLVEEGYKIYVSGNYPKAKIKPDDYPAVNFLGYLPEDLFYQRLFKSDVVVDLTTLENCLVCGAYEAIAAERPLVTSDKQALRNYFTKGAIYTANDQENIADAIKKAFENRVKLMADIRQWKKQVIMADARKIQNLCQIVNANYN